MESTKIKPKIKYVNLKNKELEYANNCDKQELDNKSQFPIGAVTEVITLYLILQLHQKKMINVQDTVKTYLKSKEDDFGTITLLDLINHRSGLKSIKNDDHKKYSNTTSIVKKLLHEKLMINTVGTCQYANINYLLLGMIIENVTELNYLDAVTKYLLTPLKMK